MVIAIEYTSPIFVGPGLLDPNLSGSRSSGGDQRSVTAPAEAGPVAVTEFSSAAILVSPTSARQASPSSEMRIFPYTKVSTVALKWAEDSTPFRSP